MQLSLSLAFIAGFVSFLSPCVLPLVPAYIGYLGGRVTNTVAAQTAGGGTVAVSPNLNSRFSTMLHGIAFVAGFTFVFVTLGLLGTAFVTVIGRQNISAITSIIGRGGGLLVILFGLHFMGILPSLLNRLLKRHDLIDSIWFSLVLGLIAVALTYWIFADWLLATPFIAVIGLTLALGGAFGHPGDFWTKVINWLQNAFYTDTRRQMVAQGHQSYAGSAIMGVIFSAGWTPCIGPIYGSILTMAATGGDVGVAGSMLLVYSLGLGIPFIVAAFLLDRTQGILRHLQRHLHTIEIVTGAFLVFIGVLVASGRLQDLSQNFATQFSDFSYNLEDCAVELNQGQVDLGGFIACVNQANAASAVSPATPAPAATDQPTSANLNAPSIVDLAASAPQIGLVVGDTAPTFSATTDTGAAFHLADLRGKVVLLNFWATWCAPCRSEMPAFQQAYATQAAQGLVVVGVNNRETSDDVTGFRTEFSLSFPLLLDTDGTLQDQFAVNAYPSTYVLNRDGVITTQHFGPLSVEEIDSLIAQALA